MLAYQEKHKWLTFSLKLDRFTPDLWFTLGGCQSKCEHVKDAPILPGVYRKLSRIYLIKGVVATVAIEGNPITEHEALECWEGKSQLPLDRQYQGREVDNFKKIYQSLIDMIRQGEKPEISIKNIKEINRELLNGLKVDTHVVPGELTKVVVGIPSSRYRGAPPEDCEYLLGRLCDWLNGPDFVNSNSHMAFILSIIKAVLAHLYLVWIHPFGDGNGRTARLLEAVILMSSGIPELSSHLLSDHYNRTRQEYYDELQESSESGGDVIPFLTYAVRGLVEGLREQVDAIQKQQRRAVFQSFAYNAIKGKFGPNRDRRLQLLYAISEEDELIHTQEIAELLKVKELYSNQKAPVLRNDINELIKTDLVIKQKGKLRAHFEVISKDTVSDI